MLIDVKVLPLSIIKITNFIYGQVVYYTHY